jgi:hypothetical protein
VQFVTSFCFLCSHSALPWQSLHIFCLSSWMHLLCLLCDRSGFGRMRHSNKNRKAFGRYVLSIGYGYVTNTWRIHIF